MPKYIVEIIEGKPDGYAYTHPCIITARNQRAAARRLLLGTEQSLTAEVCVLVRESQSTPRRYGDAYLAVPNGDKWVIRPAITDAARETLRDLMRVLDDICDLRPADAKSLMHAIESVCIDTYLRGSLDDEHPTTTEWSSTLAKGDALDGVRALISQQHRVPYVDASDLDELGGFSPVQRRAPVVDTPK